MFPPQALFALGALPGASQRSEHAYCMLRREAAYSRPAPAANAVSAHVVVDQQSNRGHSVRALDLELDWAVFARRRSYRLAALAAGPAMPSKRSVLAAAKEAGKRRRQRDAVTPQLLLWLSVRLPCFGLALFNLAVDSKLCGCDVVAIRAQDRHAPIRVRFAAPDEGNADLPQDRKSPCGPAFTRNGDILPTNGRLKPGSPTVPSSLWRNCSDQTRARMRRRRVRRRTPARIGYANDQSSRGRLYGLLDAHIGDADICLASRRPELPSAPVVAPINNALGCFGGKLILNITEKQEVGMADLHDCGGSGMVNGSQEVLNTTPLHSILVA